MKQEKSAFKKNSIPIWKHLKNYRFQSIFIRNFIIILFLVVIPNGVLSIVYSNNSQNVLQEEIGDANLSSLSRSSGMVENIMSELYSFAYNLSVNQDCLSFTFGQTTDAFSGETVAELNELIDFYTRTYEYVDSIYIYAEERELVIYDGSLQNIENIRDRSWLSTYENMGENSFVIQSRRRNDYYPYYITLICPVHAGITEIIGAVVVNVDIEEIGKIIGDNKDVTQQMLILDSEGKLYYYSEFSQMDHDEKILEEMPFLDNISGSFSETVLIDGKETIFSSIKSQKYDWRYILLSPLSLYEQKLNRMNSYMLNVTIIVSILSLIVAFFLTLKSYDPVRKIIGIIENPTPFDKDYMDGDSDKNEIQHIVNLVHNTQILNSRLKIELNERLLKLNNAQLKALQGQIDPHFLYNTLDTIYWMAQEEVGGDSKVSEMILTLAQLFRINFQRSSYLVTVKEEIEHVKLYVKILEARYKGKLTVTWDIDDNILQCKIVKLAIQPLVENAFSHGLRQKRYSGNIAVSGECSDGTVLINVQDDGIGMDEKEIEMLNSHLINNYEFDDSHVGIRNLNQRIKILFGDQYGVSVAKPKSAGKGLIVTIAFPYDFGNEK